MKKNVIADIRGLQCDNPSCEYVDESIQLEEYESYINYPCPLCSSPLLTQEDYDQVQNILAMVELANTLPPVPEELSEGGKKFKLSFKLNGTGEAELSMEEC